MKLIIGDFNVSMIAIWKNSIGWKLTWSMCVGLEVLTWDFLLYNFDIYLQKFTY